MLISLAWRIKILHTSISPIHTTIHGGITDRHFSTAMGLKFCTNRHITYAYVDRRSPGFILS